MSFIATTTVTVLRGEGTDGYGDPIDLDTPVATGRPASILETVSRAKRPVEGRTDNVRSYAGRVRMGPGGVELKKDDRVRDERTNITYTVDEIVQPTNPVGHAVTRLVLRRVT